MKYYHVRVDCFDDRVKADQVLFEFDLTNLQSVKKDIVHPYVSGQSFFFSGTRVNGKDVRFMKVYTSEHRISDCLTDVYRSISPEIPLTFSEKDILPFPNFVFDITPEIVRNEEGFCCVDLEMSPKSGLGSVWYLVHPSIAEVSKKRIDDGYYADAVEAACKALNARVRSIVENKTGEEMDGAQLMRKAFSPNNPIIKIAPTETRSGCDAQQGYMDLFAGVMTGIRNPKAHDNETIEISDALRKLILVSMLMYKIDQGII